MTETITKLKNIRDELKKSCEKTTMADSLEKSMCLFEIAEYITLATHLLNFAINKLIAFQYFNGRESDTNGKGEVLTNEEWFNSLSTEEKAEFMGDIWGRGYLTSHFEGNLEFCKKQDKAYWEKWLKQPHTNE